MERKEKYNLDIITSGNPRAITDTKGTLKRPFLTLVDWKHHGRIPPLQENL